MPDIIKISASAAPLCAQWQAEILFVNKQNRQRNRRPYEEGNQTNGSVTLFSHAGSSRMGFNVMRKKAELQLSLERSRVKSAKANCCFMN